MPGGDTLTVGTSDYIGAIVALCFVDGELEGREFVLDGETLIGRDEACDIQLPPSARPSSSKHAKIRTLGPGRCMLEDLGSKNGTYLNDVQVPEGVAGRLQNGDLIRFGVSGPVARFVIRTPEARLQPQRPKLGYSITLARAEQLGDEDGRLEWRDKALISLGRADDVDMSFTSEEYGKVSGRHARIQYTGRGFQIQDQSKNGTFVNGERIESIELEPGDIIELGPGGPKLIVEAVDVPGRAGAVDVDEMRSALDRLAHASRRRMILIGGAVVLVLAGGAFAGQKLLRTPPPEPVVTAAPLDADHLFMQVSDRYGPSTLFVASTFRVRTLSDGEWADVYEDRSFGSAFVISADGYAVTNRHVVEPWRAEPEWAAVVAEARNDPDNDDVEVVGELAVWSKDARIRGEDRSLSFEASFNTHINHNLKVVGFPPERFEKQDFDGVEVEVIGRNHADLALLKIDGLELEPASIATLMPAGEEVPALTKVLNLGFPHGDKVLEGVTAVPSSATGTVKKVEQTIQLDISVYPGNSGSPVWDVDGRVVCVITRKWSERYGECVPAQMIRELIDYLDADVELP